MSGLVWHKNVNDAIMGDKIILEARKIKKVDKPVKGSSQHKTQRAEGRHNAQAWVDIVIYPTGLFKLES
jgi:hypothetical protein